MKTLLRKAALIVSGLLPSVLLAHEGHAVPGTLTHELHHASWMIFGGMVLLAVVFFASTGSADDNEKDQ